MIRMSHFVMHMQPRCDEPWTEVVYEDAGEGKLTVRATLANSQAAQL